MAQMTRSDIGSQVTVTHEDGFVENGILADLLGDGLVLIMVDDAFLDAGDLGRRQVEEELVSLVDQDELEFA